MPHGPERREVMEGAGAQVSLLVFVPTSALQCSRTLGMAAFHPVLFQPSCILGIFSIPWRWGKDKTGRGRTDDTIPAAQDAKQKNHKFKASLGYQQDFASK